VKHNTKELVQMTPGTEDFIEKSKRLNELTARAKEVKNQIAGVGAALDDSNKRGLWGKMVSRFNSVGRTFKNASWIATGLSIASVLEAIVSIKKKSAYAAVEASDAFGGINKTTGLTTD
jgi:uncharacterized protein YidB (DUF937 family)